MGLASKTHLAKSACHRQNVLRIEYTLRGLRSTCDGILCRSPQLLLGSRLSGQWLVFAAHDQSEAEVNWASAAVQAMQIGKGEGAAAGSAFTWAVRWARDIEGGWIGGGLVFVDSRGLEEVEGWRLEVGRGSGRKKIGRSRRSAWCLTWWPGWSCCSQTVALSGRQAGCCARGAMKRP